MRNSGRAADPSGCCPVQGRSDSSVHSMRIARNRSAETRSVKTAPIWKHRCDASLAQNWMTSKTAYLNQIERRVAWTIHNANHVREGDGHQASFASLRTIMTALYHAALSSAGPGGGQAPCRTDLPRDSVPVGGSDARETRKLCGSLEQPPGALRGSHDVGCARARSIRSRSRRMGHDSSARSSTAIENKTG
ncbi:hypothetical protein HNQ71_006564 [Mesorhizobium sangaii]|uniref:Transposase n=1 Tax=Mesorhizobium sangaii TaxID=505389 RepID=A0A841PYJ2_9HYPH|nr:hypothetical protein [Mesorhizobium sangaii]